MNSQTTTMTFQGDDTKVRNIKRICKSLIADELIESFTLTTQTVKIGRWMVPAHTLTVVAEDTTADEIHWTYMHNS
jgi:uncharacterized protein (DUF111 family)